MAAKRFTAPDGPVVFRARDGDTIEIGAITVDTSPTVEPVGTTGGKASLEEQQGSPGEETPSPSGPAPADRVWATYVELMAPRNKTLHPEERRIINDAVKVASAEECSLAIAGCKGSAWHMGENPQRRKYNRISQILKGRKASSFGSARTTRETIDFFIEKYEQSGRTFGFTSEASAKIEVLKDRVRRSTSKAEEARRILQATYGIETRTRDGDGSPAAVRYEFIETGVPGREES